MGQPPQSLLSATIAREASATQPKSPPTKVDIGTRHGDSDVNAGQEPVAAIHHQGLSACAFHLARLLT